MDYKREVKQINSKTSLDYKHDNIYRRKKFNDYDLEDFMEAERVLIEFGYNELDVENIDLYMAKNSNYTVRDTLYQKCLIAENFNHFAYYVTHPFLFGLEYKNLYALEQFYKNNLTEEQREKRTFITFASHNDTLEKYYGYSLSNMKEMYPIDGKVELMDRIHKAKSKAKRSA